MNDFYIWSFFEEPVWTRGPLLILLSAGEDTTPPFVIPVDVLDSVLDLILPLRDVCTESFSDNAHTVCATVLGEQGNYPCMRYEGIPQGSFTFLKSRKVLEKWPLERAPPVAVYDHKQKEVVILKMPCVLSSSKVGVPGRLYELEQREQWLRTCYLRKQLFHENVMPIYRVFRPRGPTGEVCYTEPTYDVSIYSVIRSKQVLSEDHHKYFVYQLLKALQYIHARGIAHRNVAPKSVFLTKYCKLLLGGFDDAVLLLDPGHPWGQSEPKEDQDYVGVRWYRPPELLFGFPRESYDPRLGDIWSAGCLFFEMVTKKPLFPGKDYLDMVRKVFEVCGKPAVVDYPPGMGPEFLHKIERYFTSDTAGNTESNQSQHAIKACMNNTVAFEFLMKMLVVLPSGRPSADDMLRHPYLADLVDPSEVGPLPPPQDNTPVTIPKGDSLTLEGLLEEI